MEPTLTTAPELTGILAALDRARADLSPSRVWSLAGRFEAMMTDDFWETGASGRRYSREFVLDELMRRASTPHEDVWETSDFFCRELAADMYLLTYTLLQNGAAADAARKHLAETQSKDGRSSITKGPLCKEINWRELSAARQRSQSRPGL